jgi:hypothetical protein
MVLNRPDDMVITRHPLADAIVVGGSHGAAKTIVPAAVAGTGIGRRV